MDRWKSRGGKGQREEKESEEAQSESTKIHARKGEKVAKHCVFSMVFHVFPCFANVGWRVEK